MSSTFQTIHTSKTLTAEPTVITQRFSTRSVSPVSPVAQMSQITQVSPVSPNMTTLPVSAVNGSYGSVRYLVPVQQQAMPQQSYYVMQQPMMQQTMIQQPMIQQPMIQQPMMYYTLPRMSTSSNQETEILVQQQQQRHYSVEDSQSNHSVFSHSSSPTKSETSVYEEHRVRRLTMHSNVAQETASFFLMQNLYTNLCEEQEEEEQEEEEEPDSGTVEIEEVEIVNIVQQKAPTVRQRISVSEQKEVPEPTKLDTRFFGELLADVYRKNCDIHSYIFENVSKIRGQKHFSSDLKGEIPEVESLIPKGATELTKQQMRYLLQTRFTADKSMRLLLSTFSSLREELMQMSEDMRRLESEKESLERDLKFKDEQAKQYDDLLDGLRQNNRQLQMSLKEVTTTQRSLESQLSSTRSNDSAGTFKIKELEGRLRGLEKENEMLKHKLAGQANNDSLHLKTEALAQHYKDQINAVNAERNAEIEKLRSQISRLQTQITTTTSTTTKSSSDTSLQLRISELLSKLEQREIVIKQKEEEIRKLMMERNDGSKNVTKTVITKRYRNQYPILGLLGDDYQLTSPVKEDKTIVIERTGQMIKQETIITP
ncbi:protein POF1B [Fundulus diaphanus]